MLSLKIAWRFLRRSPGQTILIVAGIAVGIGLQVFVGSLITSLQDSLVDQTVGSSPHVTIASVDDGESVLLDGDLDSTIEEGVQDGDITAVVPQRTISVLVVGDSETLPLALIGADPDALDDIYGLSDRLVEGEMPADYRDVLLGVDFARELDLEVDDDISLVLQDGETADGMVSGLFDLGSSAANSSLAFSAGAFPADVLGLDSDEYSAIDLQVADVFSSTEVADDLRSSLGTGFEIVDWQEQQADLLTALQSQSASSYMIQVFVVIAIALGIASTLAVSAIQKTRQIGILKALGMSDGRTGSVFLWQGVLLGTLGTTAGVGLALGLIAVFQSVSAGAEEALFPIEPQPVFIAISAAVGLGIAMASAIIPSRKTARLDPIEVIQNG